MSWIGLATFVLRGRGYVELGGLGVGQKLLSPLTHGPNMQPNIVRGFWRRGNAEGMPFVLGNRWYVYEDVIAGGEAEFRWPFDDQMGHFTWQHIGLFDVGLAVFVGGYAAVAENVLQHVAEERDQDPDPEVTAVKAHDEKPRHSEHVKPVEHLEREYF